MTEEDSREMLVTRNDPGRRRKRLKSVHDKMADMGLVSRMDKLATIFFPGLLMVGFSSAQVVPANPDKFSHRSIGGVSTGNVEVLPNNAGNPKTARYITYIVLSTDRFWTSTEGKLIQGKLIAFEDMVTEAPKGAAPPPNPTPPESPTVVRDGNIRLLIKNKPAVVPLTRFSTGDLEFVEQVRKAYTKKDTAKP